LIRAAVVVVAKGQSGDVVAPGSQVDASA